MELHSLFLNIVFLFIGFVQATKHGDLHIRNDVNMDRFIHRSENILSQHAHHRQKRDKDTGRTAVPQKQLTIELGVSVDKRAVEAISQNSDPEKYVFDVMQIVDQRIAVLNLSVALTWLELWNKKDLINITENKVSDLLKKWSERRESTIEQHQTDMSVLITGYNFAALGDPINGLATQTHMCLKKAGVVVLYKGQSLNRMAQTILHELGHTLNMDHDNNTCCSEGFNRCAMGPTLNDYQVSNPKFSQCSLNGLAEFLKSDQSKCLENQPSKYPLKTSQSLCGNGMVDPGEECDCGGGCLYGCCNCCRQCRFVRRAQCASGPCCDTSSCQFRPSTFVCRNETTDSCNPADYCNGNSNECQDVQAEDGTTCSDKYNVQSICLNGRCMTRNRQCESYWNSEYSEATDKCYMAGLTMVGRFAHCGKLSETSYVRCMPTGTSNFYKCGMLQCTGPWNNPYEAATFHQSPQRNTYIRDTKCLSLSHAPWENKEGSVMVDDGTNCGDNKMCYHGDCLAQDSVLKNILNKTETKENSTQSVCGNGFVEENEECDCGPKQCDCCETDTCKFRQNGKGCYSKECFACNGSSDQCSTRHLPLMTSCDNGAGQCYNGQCSSLSLTCKKYYGEFSEPVFELYPLNAQQNSSSHNGGGYILFNRRTGSWGNFTEFQVADNDGTCGLLYCKAFVSANVTNAKGQELGSRTYSINDVNSHRVTYFTFETTRDGEDVYDKFYPLLAENGTPCVTKGQKGYCISTSLTLDRKQWNWYWRAKCVVPQ